MRKLLASLAIMTAVLAPSLHLWCVGTCDIPSAATQPACHEQQPPSDTSLSAPHNCATHEQAPAVTVRPILGRSPVLLQDAFFNGTDNALGRAGYALAVAPHPPDSPPEHSLTQLRL